LRVPVDEPVATVVNRPRPCFRRSAARLARPRRMARERGSFPGLTARLGHARETPTGMTVVDGGGWATGRRPSVLRAGTTPLTPGSLALAAPSPAARDKGWGVTVAAQLPRMWPYVAGHCSHSRPWRAGRLRHA
jgi:hypothetical protein